MSLKATVEYLTGVKINRYIKVNEKNLVKIVNAIGGVTIARKKMNGEGVTDYLSPRHSRRKGNDRLTGRTSLSPP